MMCSDTMLNAYLAGAASAEDAARIEAALATDPALERRLMALDPSAAPVREVFAPLPGPKRLEALRAALPEAESAARRGPWRGGMAIAASLAFGVLIGSQMLSPLTATASDWRLEVARYQALYVPETVAYLDATPDTLAQEMARASEALDLVLPVEALQSVGGLQLRRAQVLGFEGQPLIQLAYTDAQGTPFALCIMPGQSGGGAEKLAGLATHAWASDSHGFVLVGDGPQADVSRLADAFASGVLRL